MCYKCPACLKKRASEQAIRIVHELHRYDSTISATFTYADEYLPKDNGLSKPEAKYLIDRIKRRMKQQGRPFGYYIAGEYGKKIYTNRPHYHAILFGLSMSKEDSFLLKDVWENGHIDIKPIHDESAEYISKYIQKQINGPLVEKVYGGRQPPFHKNSRGLGIEWAKQNAKQIINNQGMTYRGNPVSLPNAYIKAIDFEFTEEHKQKLAAEKEAKIKEYQDSHGLETAELHDVFIGSNRQKRLNQIARDSLKDPVYQSQMRQSQQFYSRNGITEKNIKENERWREYYKGKAFNPKPIPSAIQQLGLLIDPNVPEQSSGPGKTP